MEGEESDEEIDGLTLLRYMDRKGPNQFFWDKKPDILKTNNNDIIQPIDPPVPVSSRYSGVPKKVAADLDRHLRPLIMWFDLQSFSPFKTEFLLFF